MDLSNMTFAGLATVGIVNVATFFMPNLNSKTKFALSICAAFALTFVPKELGIELYDKVKTALEIAFAVSGTYKMATKLGGN